MRILLILLSLSALIFVGYLGTMAIQNSNGNSHNNQAITSNQTSNIDNLTLDIIKTNEQLKYQVDELNKKVEQLSGNTPVVQIQPQNTTQLGATQTATGSTQTGEVVPISAKFLSKILPTIEPVKTDNNGIFDLRIFDQTLYTTYKDEKFGITIVASMLPYQAFLKNFQSVDKSIYSVNETKVFPFDSFYVNPAKADATVRIVMKVEAQTLLISLPKSKFNTLKELILKTK